MKFSLTLVALAASSTIAFADTSVRGYFRDNGTYVQPHYRSSPDGRSWNNYSSQGNVNPYTGQRGTADPYAPSSSYSGYSVNNLNNRNR